jgi:hypothetical protein
MRPIGWLAAISLTRSSASVPVIAAIWRMRSVRMASGARQFTVMRSGASSLESVFASPVTAARSELDRAMFGIGCRTEIEVMKTIRPWSDRLRSGSAALTSRTALISVSSKAGSQLSSGMVSNVPGGGPPAFTTRMSSPSSFVRASLTRASGAVDTSPAIQPAALMDLPVASIAAGSRDEIKAAAPSAISASAHARPRPLLAAVTSARRSFSPRSTRQLSWYRQDQKSLSICWPSLNTPMVLCSRPGIAGKGQEGGSWPATLRSPNTLIRSC